jgi:asparagine synthase (glutamine-hydrolysing)
MFSNIFQLRPAHAMMVTVKGQNTPVRYWDVKVNPFFTSDIQNSDISSNLFTLLKDAVRIHLRSDVAIGTCLSGGIDSSTIVALINDLIQKDSPESIGTRQKTFSAVFDDTRFDESQYINEVVNGTSVDAYRTQPDPQQVLKDLHQLLYIQDEPFGSLSIYAQYRVMQLASKRVKVVLDGQGADELLAGYLAYQSCSIRGLIRSFHLLTALREIIGAFRYHRAFFFDSLQQLLIRAKRRHLLQVLCPNFNRYNGTLDQVLYRELMITNLPALLHYEDRNSMAFSIESRVPYLDVRLVEYLTSLPQDQKIKNGVTKYALRRAIRGVIPESIRCRMDKMGFVTPEEIWMAEDLQPFVLTILTSENFKKRPYWDASAVTKSYQEFLDGKSQYSPELFRIVCAELWLEIFFDKKNTNPINVES